MKFSAQLRAQFESERIIELARDVRRHLEALRAIGENDMGFLTATMAGKFHASVEALEEFDRQLQHVIADIERLK